MPKSRVKLGERHLSWDLFARRLRQGPPSLEPIHGRPEAEMFIAPGGSQIGLRVFGAVESLPPSPLAEVSIRCVGAGDAAAAEVATSNPELFREFYAFCCDVADRIQVDGQDVPAALDETLRRWVSLLRKKPLMPEDKQVGLLGELWFLERLSSRRGWAFAGEAWRGPESEEHDFTLEGVDVEVKTTRSETRTHTIGSLTQLLPKRGRSLFVLSVQVTRVGRTETSLSLPRCVARILSEARRAGEPTITTVRRQIERYGWSDDDAQHYAQEWELRTAPALVPVDRRCPAIIPALLRPLGKGRASRITRVAYDVNLDELGVLDGSADFTNLLDR
jgi:hypothetical protein